MAHRSLSFLVIVAGMAALLIAGCASSHNSTASRLNSVISSTPATRPAADMAGRTVKFEGTDGAAFNGFYVVDGVRSKLSGHVPMMLKVAGLSQVAVAKVNASDDLKITASHDRTYGSMGVAPGVNKALLIVLEDGFSGGYIPAEKLASLSDNALIVIKPYWFEGTWVFDDEQTGLQREPFVSGVPEMINEVVKDISNAKEGFRLTAAERSFPGYQRRLTWVRAEAGGNFYRLEGSKLEGWLCPAMFRYFSRAPRTLYVRVDAVSK